MAISSDEFCLSRSSKSLAIRWGVVISFIAALHLGSGIARASTVDEFTLSGRESSKATAQADLTAMSLEDLMNVEVTSVNKAPQRLGDVAAAITLITQDDIQRSGLREIPEILRLAPGLFVQRGTQVSTWTVASRGMPYDFNNNLLVLQDGRSVYTPVFGGVFWNQVDYPIADLDRIEVIRGPGATLWGANAVNGVINITSKSSKETQGLLIDSRLGSDDSDITLRYGGKIDADTYYRIYGKARHLDDLNTPGDEDPNYGARDLRGGFRIDRFGSDKDVLTLQGDVFGLNSESPEHPPILIPPYTAEPGRDHELRGGNILARWTHTESPTSEYSLQAYVDNLQSDSVFQKNGITTYDFDFQHHYKVNSRHDLVYGFGARFQPFHSSASGDGLSEDSSLGIDYTRHVDLCLVSAFLQDTMTLVPDRLKFTVGSKLEYNSLTNFEIEPSARLLWTPDEKNSFWGAVSRAVRTPGLDNRTFRFPAAVFPNAQGNVTEIVLTGNPNAKSEEMIAYELGYRAQITKAWSLEVAGFLNEYSGLLVAQQQSVGFSPSPVPHVEVVSRDINGADVENYGVEVSTNLQVSERWRVGGSYSLLISHVTDQEPNITFAGTYYSAPQQQFQLHSYLDVTKNIQFNNSFYYVGSAQDSAVPAYARLDSNITWTPKPGLEFQVGVQNALDSEHPEFAQRDGSAAEIETAAYVQATLRF